MIAVTKTASLSAATAKAVNEHKQVLTITTPFWIDNDEYVLVELALEAGAGGNTADFISRSRQFHGKALVHIRLKGDTGSSPGTRSLPIYRIVAGVYLVIVQKGE